MPRGRRIDMVNSWSILEARHALVKQGLPAYGMEGVGDGHDSEGSDWIIRLLTPATLHFILRVTDKGTPPLSRYKRVVVTVVPR